MAKTALGYGDEPRRDHWNSPPFGTNPYRPNDPESLPGWGGNGFDLPNGRDIDPGWNSPDGVPNGRDIDPGWDRGRDQPDGPWAPHRPDYGGYGKKPGFGKMNGIKAKKPGMNRADFGPQNDNYDDRL